MMYFDAAYIAKCYLNEPHADRVRKLAYTASELSSCELAKIEFLSVVRHHVREHRLTHEEAGQIFQKFEEHTETGLWQWLPVTMDLITATAARMKQLPDALILRTLDALHLTCAQRNGFHEIFTNDRNMLMAAGYFDLETRNVLASHSPS